MASRRRGKHDAQLGVDGLAPVMVDRPGQLPCIGLAFALHQLLAVGERDEPVPLDWIIPRRRRAGPGWSGAADWSMLSLN